MASAARRTMSSVGMPGMPSPAGYYARRLSRHRDFPEGGAGPDEEGRRAGGRRDPESRHQSEHLADAERRRRRHAEPGGGRREHGVAHGRHRQAGAPPPEPLEDRPAKEERDRQKGEDRRGAQDRNEEPQRDRRGREAPGQRL